MGKIDLSKLKERFGARKAADDSSGFQSFVRVEKDKGRYRIRPVLFWPNGPERDPEFEREWGMHFNLESLGATMKYRKDGKLQSKAVKATRCPGLTHGQYESPDLHRLYKTLREDNGYLCSPEEIDLLAAWCPICAEAERSRADGTDTGRELGKALRVKRKYLINAVHRPQDNPRGVYIVLELGQAHSMALYSIIFAPEYEGRVFGDPAREFAMWVEGESFDRNKVQVLPEDTPLGDPVGRVTNLLDPAWAKDHLECWPREDIETILAGGTVVAPDRDAAKAAAGPKPMCFGRGVKNMAQPQCAQCVFASACDVAQPDPAPAVQPPAAPNQPAPPATQPQQTKNAAADLLAAVRAQAEKAAAK